MLASRSPQRRAILEQLGIPFRVVEPAYDERDLGVPPAELVVRHSRGKAHSVEVEADEWVLGVDTAVVLDEKVYGKPADEAEAGRMLARLSGRAHQVHSGVTLHRGPGHPDHAFTGHAMTEVRFRRLEPADISDYVAHRGMAGPRGRVRHPGTRRGARGADRRRLPERRRTSGRAAFRACCGDSPE